MLHVTIRNMKRKSILPVLLVACYVFASSVQAASNVAEAAAIVDGAASGQDGVHRVNIRISIGSSNMTATMEDNPTARDFLSLLPLTVTLQDLSDAEKVSGALPKRLSEEGAVATTAGAVGDIAYYAPWGNIAFYRRRGPDASGVIKIARITSGMEVINHSGRVRVTISRANYV